MKDNFLPVFSVDWFGLLKRLQNLQGDFGILAPLSCTNNNVFIQIRKLNKPFFIDSGVFVSQSCPWYLKIQCEFKHDRWLRSRVLAEEERLREKIRDYFEQCDRFYPDYVFAPDIFGEPLLSLYLARLAWEEYWQKRRRYTLIGVVQIGDSLYNWPQYSPTTLQAIYPHYQSCKSFLISLISEYRNLGYENIALGGLLKNEPIMRTGFKFGLSVEELDDLLSWSRPEFVLGGLALTRLEVLKKHKVWADSTNWIWWENKYDFKRFGHRNILAEVTQ